MGIAHILQKIEYRIDGVGGFDQWDWESWIQLTIEKL
jgi:hypothetical protein